MAAVKTTEGVNGIDVEVLGQTIAAVQNDPALGKSRFRAHNTWKGGTENLSTVRDYFTAGQEQVHRQPFELRADEPPMLSGGDLAANPVEHLLHALASCVTTSIVAHAAARGIRIEQLESDLEGDIDLRGFMGLDESVPKGFTNIRVRFTAKTDEGNLEKLRELAKYSPVFNTLSNGVKVDISFQ